MTPEQRTAKLLERQERVAAALREYAGRKRYLRQRLIRLGVAPDVANVMTLRELRDAEMER